MTAVPRLLHIAAWISLASALTRNKFKHWLHTREYFWVRVVEEKCAAMIQDYHEDNRDKTLVTMR